MKEKQKIPHEMAPCGVFCGACPSFEKSCWGCASKKDQKRKSKWNCSIRTCCYDKKYLSFCFECEDFPCQEIERKLVNSHPGDSRFEYRHELPKMKEKFDELGLDGFLEFQMRRWSCDSCQGRVKFYTYTCSDCGKEISHNKTLERNSEPLRSQNPSA